MCGIFGLIPKNAEVEKIKEQVEVSFKLAESRGKEAAGVAVLRKGEINILKQAKKASRLVGSDEYDRLWAQVSSVRAVIGHSRLATNGMLQDNHNNQPVAGKHAVIVHNGIVVNDEKIWKKHKDLKRKYEVDTEVLVKLFEKKYSETNDLVKAIRFVEREIKGAASYALVSTKLSKMVLYTNTGSIYFARSQELPLVFASEFYSLKEFLKSTGARENLIERLEPHEILVAGIEDGLVEVVDNKKGRRAIKEKPSKWAEIVDLSAYEKPNVKRPTKSKVKQLTKLVEKAYERNRAAIANIRRCSKCILPETMPLISFDKKGVCNYCRNWQPMKLKKNIEEAFDKYPNNSKFADCIVPFSGGRDSAFGLHYISKILGRKPIAYTYDWAMVTDLARRNQSRLVSQLGVEHIIVSADIAQKRRNIRLNVLAWLKQPDLGMVPLFMAGDKQAEYYAMELVRRTGVELVIYSRGNQLENEEFKWGHCGIEDGSPEGVLHNLASLGKAKLAWYYGKNFLMNPAYLNISLIDTAFAYFVAYMMTLKFEYLYHYIDWKEDEVVGTLIDEYGWETSPETNTTWRTDDGTVPFYNYIYYSMQGFTENDTFRSNQIRAGHIARAEALKLAEHENQPRLMGLLSYFNHLDIDPVKAIRTIEAAPKLYGA